MPTEQPSPEQPRRPWQQQLHQAAAHAEEDLRRVITYINDDVVPDLRRNGVVALRTAAAELHRLAEKLNDRAASAPPNQPPDRDDSRP